MNTYAVTTSCGHANLSIKGAFIPVTFVIHANSRSDAADYGRQIPRVRHHKADAILAVQRISDEEAALIREANQKDPFLHCSSPEQQELEIPFPDLIDRVCFPEKEEDHFSSTKESTRFRDGKKRIRKIRKYIRMSDCNGHLSCICS